ncbi:MAG: anti-sigma factor RsbA family regulatory protein [Solirubrobacteraceae bacterium]
MHDHPGAITGEGPMTSGQPSERTFSHQALFYDGLEEFLAGTVPFVRAAVEREEPVLVAVTRPRARALEGELGDAASDAASQVQFAEMERLGRNPARIIPAWQQFVEDHGGHESPVRGIGEPIWRGRSAEELAECRRHEALLNLAFADAPAWELLCPYDTSTLEDEVLEGACHTHPCLCDADGMLRASPEYLAPDRAPVAFHGGLSEPDNATFQMRFDLRRLAVVRQVVANQATAAGLPAERASDLVLAVNELAANSISHGGGSGLLRIWRSQDALVCEVRDRGRMGDQLVGRRRPTPTQSRGRGVWLANQLCDLVQIRWIDEGTAVRVRMHAA